MQNKLSRITVVPLVVGPDTVRVFSEGVVLGIFGNTFRGKIYDPG